MFANEHKGYIPPASDQNTAETQDPSRTKYSYRDDGSLKDWASHLLPYLGSRSPGDFQTAPSAQSQVFVCPADGITTNWLNVNSPGFTVYNNTTLNTTSSTQRISYAINGDIACETMNNPANSINGEGRFGLNDTILCFAMDGSGNFITDPHFAPPLNGKLTRVHNTSSTLLYADAGTLPRMGNNPLDYSDVMVYSTNYDYSAASATNKQLFYTRRRARRSAPGRSTSPSATATRSRSGSTTSRTSSSPHTPPTRDRAAAAARPSWRDDEVLRSPEGGRRPSASAFGLRRFPAVLEAARIWAGALTSAPADVTSMTYAQGSPPGPPGPVHSDPR
jgi:hypothetical protein